MATTAAMPFLTYSQTRLITGESFIDVLHSFSFTFLATLLLLVTVTSNDLATILLLASGMSIFLVKNANVACNNILVYFANMVSSLRRAHWSGSLDCKVNSKVFCLMKHGILSKKSQVSLLQNSPVCKTSWLKLPELTCTDKCILFVEIPSSRKLVITIYRSFLKILDSRQVFVSWDLTGNGQEWMSADQK